MQAEPREQRTAAAPVNALLAVPYGAGFRRPGHRMHPPIRRFTS